MRATGARCSQGVAEGMSPAPLEKDPMPTLKQFRDLVALAHTLHTAKVFENPDQRQPIA
jgi:hypothetical protein